MLSTRLIELIEMHGERVAREAVQDVVTNPQTRAFQGVSQVELASRVYRLYENLGRWIGGPEEEWLRLQYEEWGQRCFHQGIPRSEIVHALMIFEQRFRRFIWEIGQIEFLGGHDAGEVVLPIHLHGIHELNTMVGAFFDKALSFLARGHEAAAQAAQVAAAGRRGS
jgi:hypothetical protein